MRIVIVGITGNMGSLLVKHALAGGHTVVGVCRNPKKVSPEVTSQLAEIHTADHLSFDALCTAVRGADLVMCAYQGSPELLLEGQLLLVRAMERVGVKKLLSASWSYDYRRILYGDHESYDPFIAFSTQVARHSSINVVYVLTGVLAEVFFSFPGCADFSPANRGVWSKENVDLWGTGDETWNVTTYDDAAAWSVAIGTDPTSEGFYQVSSDVLTLNDILKVYKSNRGVTPKIIQKGTIDDLEREALSERARIGPQNFWSYIGLFYQLHVLNGKYTFQGPLDNDKYPQVCPTSIDAFLKQHPEI